MTYSEFITSKSQQAGMDGFEPLWMPEFLFDFQASLVEWATRKGRAAIFADCGMGKTPMQLVWAENVVRKTNRPVLIVTPIAVGHQTIKEAEKFGIQAVRSSDGKFGSAKIVVTNYERLQHFDCNDFAGAVCDESSILKNFDGKRKAEITEFMRTRDYRLLCTATAAPNDYIELGTSSECLGYMGFQDMLSMFFRQQTSKDHLGWGRTKYMMRRHAEKDFWRWVVSWARACRKPSDLGFSNHGFDLPPLSLREYVVSSRTKKPGSLFDVPAISMQEQREERRRTITERCEQVTQLVDTDDSCVCWCHLNDEGDMLESMVPDAVQVSGKESEEEKEERFDAFASGQIRVLITKPKIAGFGLNWQHCSHQTFFPSHSFEQWYQAVRRSWRFGQSRDVAVDIVSSEGEAGVLANLQKKTEKSAAMFENLVGLMNDQLQVHSVSEFSNPQKVPQWLSTTRN